MKVGLNFAAATLYFAANFLPQAMAQDAPTATSAQPRTKVQAAVAHQIDLYVASINTGDIAAAKKLWKDSNEISFINSTGIHMGWTAINNAVHTFFRDNFTNRDLRLVAPPKIQIFGNTAIAEFIWDFDGTMTSGKELHTRGGRESQVYVRTGSNTWRMVHAHYSLQPAPIAPRM